MVYSLSFSPPFLSSPFPLFTTTHPSFALPSLPHPFSLSSPFLFPSSLFLSSPLSSSLFSLSLPFRPPYFPFLSLSVLPILPFSPFSSSLFSLSIPFRPPYFPFLSLLVLPIFPFLPFRPPYSSGTLRGDHNPVAMKEFVKILFSIYRTVVLSAYFVYFILFYYTLCNLLFLLFICNLFAIFHNLIILTLIYFRLLVSSSLLFKLQLKLSQYNDNY